MIAGLMRNILYPAGKATYIDKNAASSINEVESQEELLAQQASDAIEKSKVKIVHCDQQINKSLT